MDLSTVRLAATIGEAAQEARLEELVGVVLSMTGDHGLFEPAAAALVCRFCIEGSRR
jgi:hypothetical protein